MRERHVGVKIWEFHFSSHAILAHPPTRFGEHTEPWMEREAGRRHTFSYTKEVPWSGNAERGGRDPAFVVNLFRKET